ncbi:hypothetical protein OUZ56_005580 [Daphnia magna]|uniref:Uncharacterized protein n=1 Tax=Daphnia magna TaxID=35525 RepID=A0ABQ9YTW0_9CRUS|nr:hypothetical protein OUZ56_005580 [Daphnia magna]
MTNCRLEEITLQTECPNCTMSSLGDIPGSHSGSFKHNLEDTWKEYKPCELRIIEKGFGVKYSTDHPDPLHLRKRKPSRLPLVVLGMDKVIIAVRETPKEVDHSDGESN